MTDCTVAGNSPVTYGGGLLNTAGSVILNNTIVANNASRDVVNLSGTLTGSYDLIGDGSVGPGLTNTIAGDPKLGPLASNGGPTQTMAPLAGSPASGAGSLALIPAGVATDQRGAPRTNGGAVDIGAFEDLTNIVVTTLADPTGAPTTGVTSLREAIAIVEAFDLTGGTISFSPGLTGIIALYGPLPTLTGDMTIDGPGANVLTIDAQGSGEVLLVDERAVVAISGLSLAHGAGSYGGGIGNYGALTLTDCSLTNNTATSGGGAIFSEGSLTLIGCTLAQDSAGSFGGAVENLFGSLTIIDSTLASNSSGNLGGAIWSDASLQLIDSTVSGDSAAIGGGLYNTGSATLDNSIVASSPTGGDIVSAGTIAGSHDLIGDGSGGAGLTSTIAGDPLLGPLAFNGGPTQTMALLAGSPALAAGSNDLAVDANGNALVDDQRGTGFPRIVGGTVDIGAFEAPVPSSHVNALPSVGTSLSFAVSVTGSDAPDASPAGLTTFDIYSSTNGGPWTLWTTVPASNPTATFIGQSNTVYAFYSIAHDQAGYSEVKGATVEASTVLPFLNPPVTRVASSSTYNADGTFTLNLSGTDAGGSGLAYFEVYVAIDAQSPVLVGPAVPAGVADGTGTYQATTTYVMPSSDYGPSNTYEFSSVGIDAAGLEEPFHTMYDVSFSEAYSEPTASQLAVSSLTVENGAAERSYIRYLDLNFNDSTNSVLQAIVNSVNNPTASNPAELTLTQYNLNGGGTGAPVSLNGLLNVIDNAIEIDFGVGGIGGNSGTTDADGYYVLSFTPPSGQGFSATHAFYRLLGDVNGDGVVDQNDLNEIAAARGQSVSQIASATGQPATGLTRLSMDVNGDGSVNTTDLALATHSKGNNLTLPPGGTLG